MPCCHPQSSSWPGSWDDPQWLIPLLRVWGSELPFLFILVEALYTLKVQTACRMQLKLSRVSIMHIVHVPHIRTGTRGRLHDQSHIASSHSTSLSIIPRKAAFFICSMTKLNKNEEMGRPYRTLLVVANELDSSPCILTVLLTWKYNTSGRFTKVLDIAFQDQNSCNYWATVCDALQVTGSG